MLLEIKGLGKTYGTGPTATHAVGNVSFTVDEGEFVCVVGPSGCGKTTLLKCVAGLIAPTTGEVVLGDARVAGPPPGMAVVFQEYGRSLFPWLTVWRNVALPLEHHGASRGELRRLIDDALAEVGLADVHAAYPWQLSGGMQQRVAIARALAYNPAVLLMDEPFAALDALTREEMQRFLVDVWKETKKTVVYVTHNVAEAVYLADRVIVFSPHPGTVKVQVKVTLPRPRDTLSVEFLEYQKQIVTHIVERK